MGRFENDHPLEKWNHPMYEDDPRQPWNDPRYADDPRAVWNEPSGNGLYRDKIK